MECVWLRFIAALSFGFKPYQLQMKHFEAQFPALNIGK